MRWLAAVIIAGIFIAVGNFDYASALETEAMEKEALPARASEYDEALAHLQREHPLPYTFTARDCLPSGRQCSDTRFYIPTRYEEGTK